MTVIEKAALPADCVPEGFVPFPNPAGFVRHCGGFYIHPERKLIGVRILPEHLNPLGFAHGGFLASIVDMSIGLAFKLASDTSLPQPTITLSIDYLSPAHAGAWIEAPVEIHRRGRRVSNASCHLMDGDKLVAIGRGVFVSASQPAA
ncbi:PaaI family thioesterase [Stutzerimonas tarimensis]|uniref:PaaI family thioesterase n=1 Tax=Stutzerimonas tarimensis TaxID=1507735 RepID=A0ABV7T920_9GAMM